MNVSTASTLSDHELVESIFKGELNLFSVIYERYRSVLYKRAYELHKNIDLAKDLVQETFIKALEAIKKGIYIQKGQLINWLYTIARNTYINIYRRARRIPIDSVEDHVTAVEMQYVEHQTPEALAIKKEFEVSLAAFVAGLPEKYSKAFTMYQYEHVKYEEIAEILHIPLGTVKTRIRVARRYLRMNLVKLYGEIPS